MLILAVNCLAVIGIYLSDALPLLYIRSHLQRIKRCLRYPLYPLLFEVAPRGGGRRRVALGARRERDGGEGRGRDLPRGLGRRRSAVRGQ